MGFIMPNLGMRTIVNADNNFDPSLYTWVGTPASGNGTGTFADPYISMAVAEAATLTKTTIYVKAGTYDEVHSTYYKAYNWVAYGTVILTQSAATKNFVLKPNTSNVCASSFTGFTLDGTGLASGKPIIDLRSGRAGTITLTNCSFVSPATDGYGILIQNTVSPALVCSGCTFTGVCVSWIADISTLAFASAILTSDNTEVTDGDTVTIGTTVYRFKDTMAQAYDVQRHGTTADTTMGNLIKAINASGTPGSEYYAGTLINPDVTAGTLAAHAFTVTAKVPGQPGNLIAKAESSTHLDWDGTGGFLTNGGIDYSMTITNCTFPATCTSYTITSGSAANGTGGGENTVSITNNTFVKNTTLTDIHIGKSGTYTVTGNTFTWAANTASGYGVAKLNTGTAMAATVTGTINFSNNTINCGTYTFAACALVALWQSAASKALFAVTCNSNTLSGTSATIGQGNTTTGGMRFDNCASLTCHGNTVAFTATPYLYYCIRHTQDQYDSHAATNSISYNTLHCIAVKLAYMMIVGADSTMANNNYQNGEVVKGNLFYGSNYYGVVTAETDVTHSLMVGYVADVLIQNNWFIGCRNGIVREHDETATESAGFGIVGNVFIDNNYSIATGGLSSLKIYGNTIINRLTETNSQVTFANATGSITGLQFKNNIVYMEASVADKACVFLGTNNAFQTDGEEPPSPIGCDYNLLYTNTPDNIGAFGGAYKTIAQWLAAGYDAHSIWDDGACVLPDLTDIASAMALVNPTPIAAGNVVGVGAVLTGYEAAILANQTPPITAAKLGTQGDTWDIGAILH